ncbi:hypothetical protein M422DRAFT_161714, partial [Sphaerobolus stellatus SS14]
LPEEILQDTINDIDEVSELLSLALTCRSFCQVIIPWHIEHRWISCGSGRTNVWKILSSKPYLETRIQRVEIIREGCDHGEKPLYPNRFQTSPTTRKNGGYIIQL